MTLVLETGAGVRTANSYVLPAFVTAYLTSRNRVTENTWSTRSAAEQEAACIAATQYIDVRWGERFKGVRAVDFNGLQAIAQLDFSGQPAVDDTLTLGTTTYTYRASLDPLRTNDILIGADLDETVLHTVDAVNGVAGTSTSEATMPNDQAMAALLEGTTTSVRLTALVEGLTGNDTPLSATSAGITVTSGFVNGLDGGGQPLEFPRTGLFIRAGDRVTGVPRRLREAAAEYAVRAVATPLLTDPTVDERGRTVTGVREKVGPIETETTYHDSNSITQTIKPYPAADRLLADYVAPAGRVGRG